MSHKLKRHQIPIFFAADDKYVPQLAVALTSLKENASPYFDYRIFVLISEMSEKSQKAILSIAENNIYVEFVCVTNKLDKLGSKLHLRDYYSKATYYRFFIANLFPQYDKAVYLDCDIVLKRDIAALFAINLGENYVGAAVEEVMQEEKIFGDYVEKVLGINRNKYFNAGVLVLNLKMLREDDVEKKFVDLLSKYTFRVTQDEDYLNVICREKTKWISLGWNKTPYPNSDFDDKKVKLVHYKLYFKPWLYDNVRYGDLFWEYAKKTEYVDYFLNLLKDYSEEDKARDLMQYQGLMALARREIRSNTDYYENEVKVCSMLDESKFWNELRSLRGSKNLI